jgi:hypothetical protein
MMLKKINFATMQNENWIKQENLSEYRRKAYEALRVEKKKEVGKKYIYVPHPTIPKTLIRKEI